MKNSIKERANKVPLITKVTVFFWLEWIKFNIPKERNHTEEENKEAWKYAKEKTSELINILKKAPDEIQSVMDNKAKKKKCQRNIKFDSCPEIPNESHCSQFRSCWF